jgi:hypothetical protein
MRWFRSNRGGVAWLAFFALACQLVLSFGHVHAGQFGGGSMVWAAAETGDAPADVSPSSPQKKPIGLAGDFCAICANISLANALILPILAIILAPRLFTGIFGRQQQVWLPSRNLYPGRVETPPHGHA